MKNVRSHFILPSGKTGHGFVKEEWNGVFSVELQVHKTSMEG